ncbi:MAG: hypothetical protein BGO21_12745 [Dyadobacter sp. 50-39]|nr:MAG: hypothetical protein BGO21_12745 [Dyadobacter sp. 50-39]
MVKLLMIVFLLTFGKHVLGNGVIGGHLEWHTISGSDTESILRLSLYLDETSIELKKQSQFVHFIHNDRHWEYKGWWEPFELLELVRKSSTKISQSKLTCNSSTQRNVFLNIYEVVVQVGYFRKMSLPKGIVAAWHPEEIRSGVEKNIVNSSSPYQWITTFYPPLAVDGVATMNASPIISPMNTSLLCKNQLATIHFAAADGDGDRLLYRLSKPHGVNADDAPSSSNGYDLYVSDPVWASGYSDQNQMHGDPALTINENTGEITVKPSETGQYCIGISVEEYRNGQKIGSVSFYYTLTVVDCNQQQVLDKNIYNDTTAVQTLTLCEGSEETLTSKQTFPNPQPKFQWTKDGKVIWGETSQSITIHQAGNYQLLTTDINGCPDSFDSEIVRVSVGSSAAAEMDSIPSICDMAIPPIVMNARPAGGIFTGPGVSGNTFDPRIAGKGRHEVEYVIEGTDACPGSTARRQVVVGEAPVLQLTDVLFASRGKPIHIGVTDSLDVTYQWTPPDYLNNAAYANPTSTPLANITYTVTAANASGCTATREVKIRIVEVLMIPDAFTPNSDGINETWDLKGIAEYPHCEVTIYNRWGEVIFHSIGYQNAFDGTVKGTMQMPGVYVYKIRLAENSPELTGSLTLLR